MIKGFGEFGDRVREIEGHLYDDPMCHSSDELYTKVDTSGDPNPTCYFDGDKFVYETSSKLNEVVVDRNRVTVSYTKHSGDMYEPSINVARGIMYDYYKILVNRIVEDIVSVRDNKIQEV